MSVLKFNTGEEESDFLNPLQDSLRLLEDLRSSTLFQVASIVALQVVIPLLSVAWSYYNGQVDTTLPLWATLPTALFLVPLKIAHMCLPKEAVKVGSWLAGLWKGTLLRVVGWVGLLMAGMVGGGFVASQYLMGGPQHTLMFTAAGSVIGTAAALVYYRRITTEEDVEAYRAADKSRNASVIGLIAVIVATPIVGIIGGYLVAAIFFALGIAGLVGVQYYLHRNDQRVEDFLESHNDPFTELGEISGSEYN